MKPENNWKYKSLFNLEKTYPDTLDEPPTRLVKRCRELIKISLVEYTIEDLRLMVGQRFGLNYLVPLTIEKLQDNLFVEGELYEGDLLAAVLAIDINFWKQNPDLHKQIDLLIADGGDKLAEMDISSEKFYSL
ncbi:hypothetical protein SAMN05216464_116118 [Mucilaginibacter pineti]|uniref:Uncharacterized protein n=1 Tax=Mucilaginibacter pineti TaxID=1391627 RepID=A0A1G7KGT5_9SPHI|nr:contact-dependent growth inhibition system immunity protein [Mucilaginibacter pineti]SDF36230.1 hypothetical protein SAMN05216464_116118 [Mucilaginibacter pineti]